MMLPGFKRIILFVLLLCSATVGATETEAVRPRAIDGILDLRNWDLNTDGSVKLEGEWDFYWLKLLTLLNDLLDLSKLEAGMMV